MELAFNDAPKWRRWFAWRPVVVNDIRPDADPWRIHHDEYPRRIIWLEWVERRKVRSISEQRQPFTMFVYRPQAKEQDQNMSAKNASRTT